MRVVVDLQGAQAVNRFRGIGRYSLALAQAMARRAGQHEIWITLNGLLSETTASWREAFRDLIPEERITVWHAHGPVAGVESGNRWRREAGERLRETFLASLKPDVVHVSSLFEGYGDDALTSVGILEAGIPNAVTLYDLIPLLYRDHYLADPSVRSWYERKLEHLGRARLWLAISESSRRAGMDHLNLPEEWVVNVSAAADAMYRPQQLGADAIHAIRQRYGLTRPFVMYTGGIDYRKNIEGLIRAYADLPAPLRAGYQLAIVCAGGSSQIDALRRESKHRGLAHDEVVFTGFVPDPDLVALYNLCHAFVFPSWHEGFGLPALEAMSCGAAVIGANTSSLPEVIGRTDALFDPRDQNDIATRLHAVLTDAAFRGELKRHGLEQARRFSWDSTARRTLEALERLHADQQARTIACLDRATARRPRLAYVSPLPPERSGIADYSAELLPELARHYEIDVIVAQAEVADGWIRANCPVRSAEWFDEHAHDYDRVLYHFGNSPFHWHMFGLLERNPGTVVLHDFFLSGAITGMDESGRAPGAWLEALYRSHGYHAVKEWFSPDHGESVPWKYPASLAVLRQANGVIVHSGYSRRLADEWYGEGFSTEWTAIPLLRRPPEPADRAAIRTSFGLDDEDFLVCSFGMLGPTKLNHRLLAAWLASPLAQDPRCHLAFVGENHDGEYGTELQRAISGSGCQRIHITGFAPPALYRRYLIAADSAVQLRTLSRGETSAAALDCMAHGLPTIVNAHGAAAELPDECILQLPDEFTDAELQAALVRLRREPLLRRTLGVSAARHMGTHHDPKKVADRYRDAIERYARSGPQVHRARVLESIAALDAPPLEEREWAAVARAVAANHPVPGGLKQLLVDISELVRRDAGSGIQRVVRSVLNELLTTPPAGYRIEPVYAADAGIYRYARRFTMRLLDCPDAGPDDEPVAAARGDIFLGLDLVPHLLPRYPGVYANLRRQGARLYFLVYDLLCLNRPDCFIGDAFSEFSSWLRHVAELADGAVCISRAVADQLAEWLDGAQPARARPLRIGWFHLGADIDASIPSVGVAPGFKAVLEKLRAQPSVLMVGTLEPRKGYAQSLAAFELLWNRDVAVNLVVAGKPGWKVEELVERLRRHPLAGRRLFWLENASDEMLRRLYETAHGLLMASEGEGFGLPLIEAAQHRLPILARDVPVFREIAGGHASYFSGVTAEALAEALKAWLDDLAAGRAPRSDALPWLTWAQSTRQLLDVIFGRSESVSVVTPERIPEGVGALADAQVRHPTMPPPAALPTVPEVQMEAGDDGMRREARSTSDSNGGGGNLKQVRMSVPQAVEYAIGAQRHGDLAEAERIYRRILTARPDHFDALHLLGVIANRTGRPAEAELLIRRAIGVAPRVAAAHYNLGMVYLRQGDPEGAGACFEKALEIDPSFKPARESLEQLTGSISKPGSDGSGCSMQAKR